MNERILDKNISHRCKNDVHLWCNGTGYEMGEPCGCWCHFMTFEEVKRVQDDEDEL